MRIYFFMPLLFFNALEAGETLTMDECVRMAKESSPIATLSQSKVDGAKANKREIVSQMMPQIIGKAVWDNRNEALGGELSQFQDFQSNLAGGVSANLGLCDFGSSWSHLKASSLFVKASKWEQEQMLQDLEETVRNAYLRVLEAEHAALVTEKSMKTLAGQKEISKDFFNQGLVTERDTLSVELQLWQKKRENLSAENALSRAKMELNRLIGREITTPIDLEQLPEMVETTCNAEEIVAFALQNRPEILALYTRKAALEKEIKSLRLSHAPKLYAFTNADFSSNNASVSAGIGMHLPIFEGGKIPAQVAKVRAQKEEVEASLKDFKERLVVDIQAAVLQLKEEEDSLAISRQAVELGQRNFTKNGDLYKEGHASINDLLYAEEQLYLSHLRYYSSLYRYYSALYRLCSLAGGYPLNHGNSYE